jgi:hypothetical protein
MAFLCSPNINNWPHPQQVPFILASLVSALFSGRFPIITWFWPTGKVSVPLMPALLPSTALNVQIKVHFLGLAVPFVVKIVMYFRS